MVAIVHIFSQSMCKNDRLYTSKCSFSMCVPYDFSNFREISSGPVASLDFIFAMAFFSSVIAKVRQLTDKPPTLF